LVWKDGASLASRSAYTDDSRWTAWRREVKKQRRHDSVESDPKIWSFFPKKVSHVWENAVIVTSPIHVALQKLNEQIKIAPNVIMERQNRATSKWDFVRKLAV
jgi:hypothetical protein